MSIIGNAQEKVIYTEEQLREIAHRLMGKPFDLEILTVLRWSRRELVAERYREGHAFLCGDACHLTSPTGGLGMNTGIGDAVDLSWKLDAVLAGWGGDGLLESYGSERRPIALRITRFSSGNLDTMKGARSSEKIYEDSEEGSEIRKRVGHALSEGLKREWFSMNMHLGYRYVDSPVNLYTEPESREQIDKEFEDGVNYRPGTRPGCRAPHAWLADGRSTLDLFGCGFVLLLFRDAEGDAGAFAAAARDEGIPLQIIRLDQADVRSLYEKPCVLVRPDGHVAWRGEALPGDSRGLLRKVTGN